ncbi:MAG: glycosyltransferase family A protein [Thermogemmata sp.]
MPLVSVIVPSYNKPQFLPECLRSIQAQTFTDWECIVVDDGSPRGEEIRAAVEAMGDSRYRLVRHDVNRGPGAARNTGCRIARAAYLIWVDEDDILSANCLQRLQEEIEKCNADIAHPRLAVVGELKWRMDLPNKDSALVTQSLSGSGFLIRRSAWRKVGGFDESMILNGREDLEWWIRAVYADLRIQLVDDATYFYRAGASRPERNLSLNWIARKRESKIRKYIVEKHSQIYSKKNSQRKQFLLTGLLWELEAHTATGCRVRVVRTRWRIAFLSRRWTDLKEAIRATLEMLCGQRVAAFVAELVAAGRRVARRPS